MEITQQYIQKFLKENKLAVLSTVNTKGDVHAAPIYYVQNDENEFMFITPDETEKSKNIDVQKNVVLTIVG